MEMSIRYFIQGSVRKFGDQIKITSSLLDIETGDHLWQDSFKGTMDDIFDIQEKVAQMVVEGLKVHLANQEIKKLSERGTENAEAYELHMKANDYFARQTKEGYELAIQLDTEAIKLDPGYVLAYYSKARALAGLYLRYDRTLSLLDEAEALCKEALQLKPDLFEIYNPLSLIYMHRGELGQAEQMAQEYIKKDPHNPASHFTLGFFYNNTGQYSKAIAAYEEAIRLNPDDLGSIWNLVANCDGADEREKCAHWAAVGLPKIERYLKLHPDDEGKLVWHAALLLLSGRTAEAHEAAIQLKSLKDSFSLYNTAYLFGKLGDKTEAIVTIRKAIEAGLKDIRLLKGFLSMEVIEGLQDTPEYQVVMRMVEEIKTEIAKNG